MFEVIFSKRVDISPQEATEMKAMATRAGAAGGMEIGVVPCAYITVGFIWPCGTLHVGGCATIGASKLAALGVSSSGDKLKLDPKKNADLIQKMLVAPGVKTTKPTRVIPRSRPLQP
jgi:hypothetical protein